MSSLLLSGAFRCFTLVLFVGAMGGCQSPAPRDTHERLHGVLWMQTAPEYAVSAQTVYRSAAVALDAALKDTSLSAALEQTSDYYELPPAVILDIDETVLDNTRMQGQLVRNRSGYDADVWNRWIMKSAAKPVPGALEFIDYARSRGVRVFYVTNRDATEEQATRKNLENVGIILDRDLDTVLMSGELPGRWPSDKSSRRKCIAQTHRILLLIGDDLGDFVSGAKSTPAERKRLAEQYRAYWGGRWFLLPNPVYGSWESALYGHDSGLDDADVLKLKFDAVEGFE